MWAQAITVMREYGFIGGTHNFSKDSSQFKLLGEISKIKNAKETR
jgi:hypothetical protein